MQTTPIARNVLPGVNHLSDRKAFVALLALVAVLAAMIGAVVLILRAILRAPTALWRRAREANDRRRSWARSRDDDRQTRATSSQAVRVSAPAEVARPAARLARLRGVVERVRLPTLADAKRTLKDVGAFLLLPLLVPYWLGLAAKGVFVFVARRLRRRASARERGIDEPRPLIFVSYRTTPHAAVARQVSRVLEQRGFEPWLDHDRGLLPSRTTGFDARLDEMIRRADVVVAIRGAEELAAPPAGIADRVDDALAVVIRVIPWAYVALFAAGMALWMAAFAVLFWPLLGYALIADPVRKALKRSRPQLRRIVRYTAPAPALTIWYRRIYHVDILPCRGESWQLWERRMADLYGVPIVEAMIGTEASTRQFRRAGTTSVLLRPDRLEEDISTRLVRDIVAARAPGSGSLETATARFWARLDEEVDALAGHQFRAAWWCVTGGWLRTVRTAARALAVEPEPTDVRPVMWTSPGSVDTGLLGGLGRWW